MPLGYTLARAGLLAGLTLGLALPLAGIAAWSSRPTRWRPLLFAVALVAVDATVIELPRAALFQRLHWSWQECLLSAALPFLMVALVPGITLASIGVTTRFRTGWFKPCLIVGSIAVAVPLAFFALGLRKRLTTEGWIFLSLMPGLAEELVFRGALQSLLNGAFGRPWRLAGVEVGWGIVITALLFAGFNGLVNVDAELHVRVALPRAVAPFVMSLASGWIRGRSDSVWFCVLGHNLSNIVVPLLSLAS